MSVKPIPEGFHTITAQLSVDGAADAIAFYQKAFGAEVVQRAADPSGAKVWHAALRIGDSMLFVNDVFPDMGGAPSNSNCWLYVNDCDASFKRAVDAGAKASMPPTDMFWGDRMYYALDREGHHWNFAQHMKDVASEDMKPPAA